MGNYFGVPNHPMSPVSSLIMIRSQDEIIITWYAPELCPNSPTVLNSWGIIGLRFAVQVSLEVESQLWKRIGRVASSALGLI